MSLLQAVLAVLSGSLVGFTLGLIGGGGSILATPLLVYVVGIANPHVAIGTSAVAVAANAALNLSNHARRGTVKWRCALVFAASGVLGALVGAAAGKAVDGEKLLALFSILMVAVGVLMLRNRKGEGLPGVKLSRENFPRLVGIGLGAGLLSGFFGVGGGFLIVPGLILATGMPILNAVSSSLAAVTAFGASTAGSYALSGLVDWPIAGLFVAGGALGGLFGVRAARALGQKRGALNVIFAVLVFVVAAYVFARNVGALAG